MLQNLVLNYLPIAIKNAFTTITLPAGLCDTGNITTQT